MSLAYTPCLRTSTHQVVALDLGTGQEVGRMGPLQGQVFTQTVNLTRNTRTQEHSTPIGSPPTPHPPKAGLSDDLRVRLEQLVWKMHGGLSSRPGGPVQQGL